jgi:hypothetical protein
MPSEATDNALEISLASYKGHYDELILVVNDGIGYGPAVNIGLKQSTGDAIIVSNNDVYLKEGTLRDLPFYPAITVPMIEPEPRDYQPRAIFCMPRWIYTKVVEEDGYFYDPKFEVGYFEDDDLIRRLEQKKITTIRSTEPTVHHFNGGGLTMKQMGEQHWFDVNQQNFNDKWS